MDKNKTPSMDRDEIGTRIIEALSGKFKHGAYTKDLMDSIGIKHNDTKENTATEERKFYDELKSLRKQKKIVNIPQGRNEINFLPKYNKAVMIEWGIDEKDLQLQQELKNIHSGYVFVEKSVLKQGKGIVSSYQEDHWYYRDILPYSLLPIVPHIPDNQDALIFLIENLNEYPIKEVGASILIDKYSSDDCTLSENCRVKRDSHTFNIICDELLPNETAFAVIPLKESDINWDFEDKKEEKIWFPSNRQCDVQGWCGTAPLTVRKGRLTKEDTDSPIATEIQWDKSGFKKE